MVADPPVPMAKEANAVADKPIGRSTPNKRNNGKVPKKIHKAEREKLKRDHLNELFLELGNALESVRQNSGKASVLDEATRFLRDLLAQVECLKRENAALLSESHYVTVEKNELRDENSVLEAEIEKLRTELWDRAQVNPTWDAAPAQLQHKNIGSHLSEDCLALPVMDPTLQQSSVVGPVFVIPLHEPHGYPEPETTHAPSKPSSHVSKPHARYPTPSDMWPSRLLVKLPTSEDNLLRQSEQ
ncbi:transcription factor bHLH47 [Macadamia integrifolia]|uniref:transcription factor bHLH47 n=1 Tax=Macadamia integrifolia TaxID=60698 RepID=UPI001C4F2B04|nr:transcription factor bHLH47 [Macadamia integrifolia]XP_042487248.1 transcription factor bHLH47 [Macadamia integrifolia]